MRRNGLLFNQFPTGFCVIYIISERMINRALWNRQLFDAFTFENDQKQGYLLIDSSAYCCCKCGKFTIIYLAERLLMMDIHGPSAKRICIFHTSWSLRTENHVVVFMTENYSSRTRIRLILGDYQAKFMAIRWNIFTVLGKRRRSYLTCRHQEIVKE